MTELVVVIAIITVLASLLLPALNSAKSRTQTISCLGNLKQLEAAWQLYVDSNDDFMPPNNPGDFGVSKTGVQTGTGNGDTKSTSPTSWCPGNARTDLTTANIQRGLLFPYVGATDVYHCPADRSQVIIDGQSTGVNQTRSYAMSSALNCDTGGSQPAFKKYSELIDFPPHMVFVFVDVNEQSISDGSFQLYPDSVKYEAVWPSMPSDRHNLGVNMSFADGHVEHWNWAAPKQFKQPRQKVSSTADLKDLMRMQSAVAQ